MVKIRSFKGLLANKYYCEKIIAPAYDTLNSAEAREMASGNPCSFLHVNKPEIDLREDMNPYDTQVYEQGRDALQHFIKEGHLV